MEKDLIADMNKYERGKLAEALDEMDAFVTSYKFTKTTVIVNGKEFKKVSELDDWMIMHS